jgi:hypothetical protein
MEAIVAARTLRGTIHPACSGPCTFTVTACAHERFATDAATGVLRVGCPSDSLAGEVCFVFLLIPLVADQAACFAMLSRRGTIANINVRIRRSGRALA